MARDEIYDVMKAHYKEKFDNDRRLFMSQAVEHDDGGWTKHTQFHWSRMVAGFRLDYWPSRKKFQYRGKVRRGDVNHFIRCKEPVVHKASNVMLQSQNAAKSMGELHEKMLADGFMWDGMGGYSKTVSS